MQSENMTITTKAVDINESENSLEQGAVISH